MNMTFGQALERAAYMLAIIFVIIWLYGKFTTEPDLYVKPPANVVHDRCEYVSDGQPFYIGDDDRTDIDANDNGIACEPEDMR
jgi:hypothetical protein